MTFGPVQVRDPSDGEFTGFTWQYCSEHQPWDTREAADSAASRHLFDHPLRWLAVAGTAARWTRHHPGSAASWSVPDPTRRTTRPQHRTRIEPAPNNGHRHIEGV